MVDESVATFPVFAQLVCASAERLVPKARRFIGLEGGEGSVEGVLVGAGMILPEVEVVEKEVHVDVKIMAAAEDGAIDGCGVDCHLGVREAVIVGNEVFVLEIEQSRSENNLNSLEERLGNAVDVFALL